MFEQHYTHRTNLDKIHAQINTFKPTLKMDLLRMWRNCNHIFQEMDKELVTCRRKARLTSHYTTLEHQLKNTVATLEKRMTFAYLM